MTKKDVARVLPQEKPAQREYLVLLMEEFDLAFSAGDVEGQWLVPQRLAVNQPELPDDLKAEAFVRLRWTYKALPEGLLPEFITRTHVLSDELPELRWANGVVLESDNGRVLVKADRQDKTIIAVSSGKDPELIRHVEEELDTLNREIPGLDVDKEMEVIPDGWVKVALLRKMEPKGIQIPVTFKDERGADEVEMVLPKQELNRIGPERARNPKAWKPLVFISYADKDRKALLTMCDYLKCYENNGIMEVWHDKRIIPGSKWNPAILEKMLAADVIVFLISPSAMGSEYIRRYEIPAALKRSRREKIAVIPLLLEQTDVTGSGLDRLQGIKDLWRTPVRDTKPQRKAWFQVSSVLKETCQQLLDRGAPRKKA